MEKETVIYELSYHLKPDLKDEEILAFTENLRNIIAGKKGLIISEGKPKKAQLAYSLKKESSSIFNWIKFMINPALISEIQEALDRETIILRHMAVKAQKEEAPRKPAQEKKDKEVKLDLAEGEEKKEETIPAEEAAAEPKEAAPVTDEPVAESEKDDGKEKERQEKLKIQEEEIDKKIEELLGE